MGTREVRTSDDTPSAVHVVARRCGRDRRVSHVALELIPGRLRKSSWVGGLFESRVKPVRIPTLCAGTRKPMQAIRYSYFNAVIGSTRDARCAGMKAAQSATSDSATVES